ncbi:hypothetical protein [Actinomadura nitritigenes]|uniref:hypothetical protein n=1 Tax=Actinomadura nitritigenes TaxID=134602 RepID=UPI003D8F17E5
MQERSFRLWAEMLPISDIVPAGDELERIRLVRETARPTSGREFDNRVRRVPIDRNTSASGRDSR